MSKNWQYFIHSTDTNLLNILKSGYLYPKIDKRNYGNIIPEKYIYTHLIFNGLPQYEKILWHYSNNNDMPFIFVFDTSMTKEYEMHICLGLYYGSCIKNENYLLLKSNGNLKKQVSLTKVKEYIQSLLTYNLKKKYSKYTYIRTHEVLFPTISIDYVKAILINKDHLKKHIHEVNKAIDEYPHIKFIIFDSKETNFDIYFNDIK